MHLTSVTLRGFKSFADRTRLDLEPGLIAVVGPNGAGKSNLIDALIWALGAQGTRALRLERMEDVIFAGTTTRPPLGMAQVVLTFDNTTQTFPLEFSEVQIGRSLYRDGASGYTLNNSEVRLLDIQELLSEAGIGRDLHAVVAQGQVEEIVQARPEELRSFVEEAAGISKHRRRKERALRKIDQVDADLARAADLAGEMRRQIRPLKQQAEQAEAHHTMTDRLRELRIRLAVGELALLEAERARALSSHDSVGAELASLRGRLEALRSARGAANETLEQARGRVIALRSLLEALRSGQTSAIQAVVILRERLHSARDERRRDAAAAKLEAFDAEDAEVRSELDRVVAELTQREAVVNHLRTQRTSAREEAKAASEELARVSLELSALEEQSQMADREAFAGRTDAGAAGERVDRAAERITRLQQQTESMRGDIERLDADGMKASAQVEKLAIQLRDSQGNADEAERRLRSIDNEVAVLAGRLESLKVAREMASSRRLPAEEFNAATGASVGARGVLGELIVAAPGLEQAVEAALGGAVDALVVAGAQLPDAIVGAEAGGFDLLLVPTATGVESGEAPPGTIALAGAVEVPGWLRGTIEALLEGVYVVDDWSQAGELAAEYPEATFVTPSGRVLRPRGVSKPAPSKGQSVLGLTEALERTEASLTTLGSDRSRWQTNADRYKRDISRIGAELEHARALLHETEGRIAAAADRLSELTAEEQSTRTEREIAERDKADRLEKALRATARREQLESEASALREAEAAVTSKAAEATAHAERLGAEMAESEAGLTELLTTRARLTERLRGVERARDELRAEVAAAQAEPTDPADLYAAEGVLARIEAFVAKVEGRTTELTAREQTAADELARLGGETSRLEVAITSLEPRAMASSETVTRLDVRLEEVGTRIARDFELPPARAREEFPLETDPDIVRAEERRLDTELRRMGPVNPLAAQEVGELEERHQFLEAQLEDLRRSRRDLLRLVRAAEERMREMLVAAVDDAAVRFTEVIGLLFPEGDGRLRMTETEDPLEGGVEIEVRLGRKGPRRLSFLSGGEKALAGLGFLFALHLARPTPFLVLDEVDAPLDDANLGRFLRLLDSLRHRTQVLVVTHQKRTMERADSLIGVTLNPDGSTKLVTQRLGEPSDAGEIDVARDAEPASAS